MSTSFLTDLLRALHPRTWSLFELVVLGMACGLVGYLLIDIVWDAIRREWRRVRVQRELYRDFHDRQTRRQHFETWDEIHRLADRVPRQKSAVSDRGMETRAGSSDRSRAPATSVGPVDERDRVAPPKLDRQTEYGSSTSLVAKPCASQKRLKVNGRRMWLP